MILAALLLAQTAGPADPPEQRFERCADKATTDSAAGEAEASAWRIAGGGFLARQCLGLAYNTARNFNAAGAAFEMAAREAEVAKDARSAKYWAQAGNAWIAAGEPLKARGALDAALAAGTLKGLALGEAHLDRARAKVAAGDLVGARSDLDRATVEAADDPLAWLLSATLARRTGDLPRAHTDIAQALQRSADDASVQLEAGNIAAASGDETGAKAGWTQAAQIAPDSPAGTAARQALAQFAADK